MRFCAGEHGTDSKSCPPFLARRWDGPGGSRSPRTVGRPSQTFAAGRMNRLRNGDRGCGTGRSAGRSLGKGVPCFHASKGNSYRLLPGRWVRAPMEEADSGMRPAAEHTVGFGHRRRDVRAEAFDDRRKNGVVRSVVVLSDGFVGIGRWSSGKNACRSGLRGGEYRPVFRVAETGRIR